MFHMKCVTWCHLLLLWLQLLNNTFVDCRCHGFSTACNIKTCTRRLHHFKVTAQKVLQRYGSAVQVEGRGKGRPRDLLFSHASPDYCRRNLSLDILGTRDRRCSPAQTERAGSCTFLCCERGYYTKNKLVAERECKPLYDKAKGKYQVDCSVVRQRLVSEHRCH